MKKESVRELIQKRVRDLRAGTDFVSALFETLVGYAIIAADFDGNVIAYNEGARLIYGYSPEEIIGRHNVEIFFPKEFVDAGNLQKIINDLIGKGKYTYEGQKVRKNREMFQARGLYTLTKDKRGKVVGFIEIVEDLTERERLEKIRLEALASAVRVARLEKELTSLERLSRDHGTSVTAQSFGVAGLRENVPTVFEELVRRYGKLMDLAIKQRTFKDDYHVSDDLRSMCDQLGFLKAGPRDVVELHGTALKMKSSGVNAKKSQAYAEEGRFMIIELLGYLVSYYQRLSLGPFRKGMVANKK